MRHILRREKKLETWLLEIIDSVRTIIPQKRTLDSYHHSSIKLNIIWQQKIKIHDFIVSLGSEHSGSK